MYTPAQLTTLFTMPNRVIRDWTLSKSVNSISWEAECMFTRLIMKADDYGCFHAEPIILRSLLFPLRDVEYFHIDAMLDELERKSLIILYDTDDGKQYLQIVNFGQRLRNMRDNHPKPDDKSR